MDTIPDCTEVTVDDSLQGENIGRSVVVAVFIFIGPIMIYRSPTAVNRPTDWKQERRERGLKLHTFMRQNQHRNEFLVCRLIRELMLMNQMQTIMARKASESYYYCT